MNLPEIEQKLREWAHSKQFVLRMWIYGSRSRDDFTLDSDLDVAIEIGRIPKFDSTYSAFSFSRKQWAEELAVLTGYQVHLAHLDPADGPDLQIEDGYVAASLARSSRLVFDRANEPPA